MLLKSIDIQGFKSFADKTHLQFGKGITAVVGPNGSGKSNISDAVRWVLGEQSTKSLRGASMEDVIFLGSDTRRAQGFAEVTLTIDNSDRSLNFDNDTVAVTRRYYRSHESEYLINGVSVRLRDVNELFMDTGLGRDGYSMIGQGKIDSIVGAKPNERRDIFEEASGISRYRYRKLEAERKLSQAEDNLVRLNDIFAELQSRIGPLKHQSEKAEKYLKFREEKKELEIGLWLNALDNSKDTLRNHERKITVAQDEYDGINKKLGEIAEGQEKLLEQNAFFNSAIEQKRRRSQELEEEATRKEGEIAVVENTILHNNQNIERVRFEIDGLKESDVTASENIKSEKEKLQSRQQKLLDTNKLISDTTEELNGLIKESEGISNRIEELVLSLNDISAKATEEQVRSVSASTALEEISTRVAAVEENRRELEDVLAAQQDEFKKLEADRTDLEESISSYNNTVSGYKMRRTSREESVKNLTAEIDKLGLDIEDLKRRINMLQELEQNMEGFNFAVKAVMKSHKEGTLHGIHGPFVRLIDVDKEYSVAIETALGNAAQNVVVENEGDAKRAIKMLKSENKGRATFLPVSSIEGRYIDEPKLDNCLGFVGIASDLVNCDSKYKQIAVSLLGRIVVAEDLDSAVAIAKKFNYKYKIVSLDGQVVNAGGSMTGGSLSKHTGLLSRGEEINTLKQKIVKLNEKLELKNAELKNAESSLEGVNKDIANIEAELKTANEDLIRVLGEMRRVDELISTNKNNVEGLQKELEDCATREETNKQAISLSESAVEELNKTKQKIQDEIDEISGGRTNLSERRDELSERLTALKLQNVETEKDIESISRTVKSMEDALNDRSYRVEQLELERLQILEQNDGCNARIEELKEAILKLREDSKEEIKQANELRANQDEAERQNVNMRAEERALTEQRERLSGELVRLQERRSNMMHEYDDIIKKLFDEYELTKTQAEELDIQLRDPAAAKRELSEIKGKMKALGDVNIAAIEEYKEVGERYEYYKVQIEDVEKSRKELYKIISGLTETMRDLFVTGFEKINRNFSKTFTDLFGGGSAELILSDPENVLESGIDISVRIPGKTVSKIEPLSGGEKALVAISIYFAIMMVAPPPFCLLDEVESALDEVNVDRVADYMHRMNDSTQFICITHRRGTMEAADMLYGVTMQEKGVSKLLEINVSELEKKLKTNIK